MVNSTNILICFKLIIFGIATLHITSLAASTNPKMLIFDGLAKYADRLEILPSDDCSSFEIRSWGRIVDKKNNLLSPNDIVNLTLYSGEINIVKVGKVLSISDKIDDEFDVVYLSFGNWSWDAKQLFQDLKISSLTVLHDDGKANIESNSWQLPNLPENLNRLKQNCNLKFGEV